MAAGFPVKADYANGDVLTATNLNDLAGTVNLIQTPLGNAAGKNKIINGDFGINQRKFTSNTTSGTFNFDRWSQLNVGGTVTCTPQVFTPGAAPVVGYESTNFLQIVTASQSAAGDLAIVGTRLEDVRLFAGQTITMSFYAKATSGTPKIGMELNQNFGSGGSPEVNAILGAVTLSTSWARYSISYSIPSITGKTIGTSSYLQAYLWLSAGSTYAARSSSIGIQNNTFQIWGVQLEAGSTATPFQTATGSVQGELAACQRYYYRMTNDAIKSTFGAGFSDAGGTTALIKIPFKQTMRTTPTALEQNGTASDYAVRETSSIVCSAVPAFSQANTEEIIILFTVASGLTVGRGAFGRAAVANAYLGWSAEL